LKRKDCRHDSDDDDDADDLLNDDRSSVVEVVSAEFGRRLGGLVIAALLVAAGGDAHTCGQNSNTPTAASTAQTMMSMVRAMSTAKLPVRCTQ